jgi:hypothetical protein
MRMKTNALLTAVSVGLLACTPALAATPPCDGVAPVALKVESAARWEESRLTERTPKAPKLEGVRFQVRPESGLSRAGLERSLSCGLGAIGEALVREGAKGLEVREVSAAYEVRARVGSEEAVTRLLEALR